jgi:Ca2+-binding RTX toxin-like protein
MFSSWIRRLFGKRCSSRASRRPTRAWRIHRLPLSLERLEDRLAPAVSASLTGVAPNFVVHFVDDDVAPISNTLEIRHDGGQQLEWSVNGGAFTTDLDTATPGTQSATMSTIADIQVDMGSGDDVLRINNQFSDVLQARVTFDGGTGTNRVELFNGFVTQLTYTAGAAPGQGQITAMNGVSGNTLDLSFTNLQVVNDSDSGGFLTVNGNGADNAITYSSGPAPFSDQVSVDALPVFNFSDYKFLTFNGLGGSDTITLNNPTPGPNVQSITVDGGDPTAGSDTLVVNGRPGVQDDIRMTPTAVGAGTVTGTGVGVTFAGTEQLDIVGQAADRDILRTVGTAGADTYEVAPGAAPDAGSVTGFRAGAGGFAFTPIAFSGITGFIGPGVGFTSADTAIIDGTPADDTFRFSESTAFPGFRSAQVNNDTEIFFDGPTIVLRGLAGNDTFNTSFTGAVDGRPIRIEGGDGTDTINHTANANAATAIDLAAGTITTTGGNPITFTGVERINQVSSGANSTLTVTGTAADDTIDVTPTAAGAGSFAASAQPGVTFGYTGVGGAFTVNGGSGGFDTLGIVGGGGNDAVTLTPTTATLNAGVVTLGAGLDALSVSTLGGNDSLTVDSSTGAVPLPISYDGGAGTDTLTLTGGTATSDTYSAGPTPGSGSSVLVIGGVTEAVTFTNLEPVVDNVAGPLVVNGTNGDDAINYTQGSVAANGLVSVNNQETIEFSNKSTLALNGLAGNDTINLNNPNTPTGLTGITVDGGDPTGGAGDTLIVNGIPGTADVLGVTPTAAGGGTLTGLPVGLTFAGIEGLTVIGQTADTDRINFEGTAGNDTFEFTPGATPDAGTVTGFQAGGFAFTPVSFSGFRGVQGFEALGLAGTDTLIVDGTPADDIFALANSAAFPGAPAVTLTNRPEIVFNVGFSGLTLRGLAGNDTFNLNFNPPPAFTNPVRVEGGDGSDTINHTANANAATTIDLTAGSIASTGASTVTFAGVEQINQTSSGAASTLTVTGTAGDDTINVSPTGAGTGTFTTSAFPGTTFVYRGVGGAFTVTGGSGGFDTLGIVGGNANDAVTLTPTTATLNSGVVTLGAGLDALSVSTLGGNDSLTVDSTAGAVTLPIAYDGGAGTDTLTLTGNTATSDTYSAGPAPGSGTSTLAIGGATETVSFTNLEPVFDFVAGPLVVNGTNGDDVINYTQGSVAANGLVSVNNQETIEFSNKTTLTINALAGSDTINLNNPNTPAGLTGITVNGGDPTGGTGDTLIVNGTPGPDTLTVTPTAADAAAVTGAGPVTITAGTIEQLQVNGQGGNDTLTVVSPNLPGVDIVTYTPGPVVDAGSVSIDSLGLNAVLLPLTFSNLGKGGSVTLLDGAPGNRRDTDVINGTAGIDFFGVDATSVSLLSGDSQFIPVNLPGANQLTLNGLGGDDQFTLDAGAGTLPYLTTIDGGAGSNSVRDIGDATLMTVFRVGTPPLQVQGGGLNFMELRSISALNIDNGVGDITLQTFGTPNAGTTMDVTPFSNRETRITTGAGQPVISTFNSGTLTLNGNAGDSDAIAVEGTAGADTITVTTSTIQVNALKTITYSSTMIDALRVFGHEGADTFNITPGTVPIFVDGGDPIGGTPGDQINVNAGANAITFNAGPHNDEGSINVGASAAVSFDNIETVGLTGAGAGSSATVNGTNADDDITVVGTGTQDFTVSVNAGTAIQYTDVPVLTINALAGDDDVSVTPFYGVGGWQMTVNVNGDDPAASDTLVVAGSAGADAVDWTPATGVLLLNGGAATTAAITVATTERLVYSGLGGNDTLQVNGTGTFTYRPGAATDAGSIALDSLLPIEFQGLGAAGTVTVNSTGPADTLLVQGTTFSDTFVVNPTSVQLNDQLPVTHNLTAGDVLELSGSASTTDAATVNSPTAATIGVDLGGHMVTGLGAAIDLDGIELLAVANTGGTDTVNVTGVGLPSTLTAVTLAGLAGDTLTATGSAGDDTITVTPAGPGAGTFRATSGNPTVMYSNFTGGFTVNGGAGTDTLGILGNDGNNTVTVTPTAVTLNGGVVTFGTGLEALNVSTLGGNDALIVNSTAGAVALPITYDGGTGTDSLTLTGGTATSDTYTAGPAPGSGSSVLVIGGVTQTVNFLNLEPVIDLVGGPLAVQGNNAANAISYTQAAIAADGLVSIDNQESIEFSGKTTLTINGLGGADAISLNNPSTPTGLTAIAVDGGDPTGPNGDTLSVNGVAGALSVDTGANLITGAGPVNINYTGVEALSVKGVAGTVLTLAGSTTYNYVPGVAADAGTVQTDTVPVAFTGISPFTPITVQGSGGAASLVVNGTAAGDVFNVNSGSGVQLVGHAAFTTTNIAAVTVNGLDGADSFTVTGSATPYTSLTLSGGTGTDSVTLTGTNAAVTLTLGGATTTVAGGGLANTLVLADTDLVTLNAGSGAITVNGHVGPDDIVVTPTTADTAVVQLAGTPPAVSLTTTGTLTVAEGNANDGDTLTVRGTPNADTITVDATAITVAGLKAVNYSSANIESLRVEGDAGADTFNVTPGTRPIFIDGGDPIGGTPGDRINVNAGANPVTFNAGPHKDQGSFTVGGAAAISFTGIETIGIIGAGPGSSATVDGTNGDDAINVIGTGTQDFTVSVNDGTAVQYTNVPVLTINALAGDDVTSITPFFGPGGWQMTINANGDDPAASDTLIVAGSTGANAVDWTPATGALLLDGGAATTAAITVATTERLVYSGLGGNDSVRVNGTGTFTYRPGAAIDAGSIALDSLLPLEFQGLGAAGTVTVNSTGPADTLVIQSTAATNTFVVNPASVQLNDQLPVTHNLAAGDMLELLGGTSTTDAATVNSPTAATVGVDLAGHTVTGLGAAIDLDGIELLTVVNTGGTDTVNVTGVGLPSTLVAVTLAGLAGDTLTATGSAGDDTINVTPAGAGAGTFRATGFSPTVTYTNFTGGFTVNGGTGGFDTLVLLGNDNANTVTSTATTVTLDGSSVTLGTGLDQLNISTLGGNDNVTLTGLTIPTRVDAGDGDDRVNATGVTAPVTLLGGAGNDALTGGLGNDLLDGGDGNDVLNGGPGANTLLGGDGSDILFAGSGADLLDGGAGDDFVNFQGGAGNYSVGLLAPIQVRLSGPGGNSALAVNVEELDVGLGAGTGNFLVADLSGSSVRSVDVGASRLVSGGFTSANLQGTLTVQGTNQADTIRVADGPFNGLSRPTVFVPWGGVTFAGSATATLAVQGLAGDDTLSVDPAATLNGTTVQLFGGDGNDTLTGGPGNDLLDGGAGNDVLVVSGGADTFVGGAGFDVIRYAGDDNLNVMTLTQTGTVITVGGLLGGAIDVSGGGLEEIDVLGFGGNDVITLSGLTIAPYVDAGDGNDSVNASGVTAVQATLLGGNGDDLLIGTQTPNTVAPGGDLIDGGAGNDTLQGGIGNDTLLGGTGDDTFIWNNGDNSDVMEGGDGTNTVVVNGANNSVTGDVFTVNANGPRVRLDRTNLVPFSLDIAGVQQLNLNTGLGADSVTLNDLSGTDLRVINVDLGTEPGVADSLIVNGRSTADNVTVALADTVAGPPSPDAIQVSGLPYVVNLNLANLDAANDSLTVNTGAGDDTVTVGPGTDAAVRLNLDGGPGNNKLDLSGLTTARTLNLANGTLTGFAGVANFQTFIGSAAADTLVGPNTASTWNLTGANAGTVNGVSFSSFENLTGGTANDTFVVAPGASLSGTLDGGTGSDTLVGPNAGNVFNITGTNSGNLNGVINFVGVENLTGGASDDRFVFANGVAVGVAGTVDGGPGVNTLDYSASTLPIAVNLQTRTATGTGGFANVGNLVGGSAVDMLTGLDVSNVWNLTGPDNGSVGGFTFTSVESVVGGANNDTFNLAYGAAQNRFIDGGPGGFDVINLSGSDGANAIVANTASQVTIDGQTVSLLGTGLDLLVINALGGDDMIDLTQFTAVPVQVFGGDGNDTILGTPGNDLLDGGAGNDSIVGGAGNDTIQGGDGNDTVVGGTGTDQLFGGAGSDTFVWNPGDGSDVVEGGDGTDVLQFNGAAAAEAFALNANGSRVQLLRNLGTVNMDLAGVEQINLAAGGGPDTVTVNDLTGTDLRTLNLDLGAGDGAADAVTVNGRNTADNLAVGQTGGVVNVTGLGYGINVSGAEVANDSLTVHGNGGNDTFSVTDNVNTLIQLNLDGGAGSGDTLDLSSLTTPVTFNLQTGTVSGFGTVTGFESFVGTAGSDTIIGVNAPSIWNLTGTNAGSVNGLAFASVENLTGGSAADTFLFSNAASFSGVLNGDGGSDTLNYAGVLTPVTVNLQNGTATGTGGIASIENLIGGGAADTLVAPNGTNTWSVTALNAGVLNGAFTFSGVENLTGGTGADTFMLANDTGVTGTIDGGAGSDAISFAALGTPRTVRLTGFGATDGFSGTDASLGGGFTNIESLTGSAGLDTLVGLDAQATWTTSQYTSGGRTLSFASFETLDGGAANDTFNITASTVTAPLTVNGGGQAGDTLTVDDTAATADKALFLTANQVGAAAGNNLFPAGGSLTYAGVAALSVLLGSGNDQVAVFSTAPGTATSVNSGAGNDTFTVPVTASTGLNNLTLDGGPGTDTLNVQDTQFGSVIRTTQVSATESRVDITYVPGQTSTIRALNIENVQPNLSAEQNFVQALYHDVLGRSGNAQEIAGWIDLLHATGSRNAVVRGIENSLEGIRHRVDGWYVQFLNREAHDNEEQPWVDLLLRGATEEQTLSGILASPEYFALSGSTNDGYVRRLYRQLLGREGQDPEVQGWVNAIPTFGRFGVALMIQQSPEYRTRSVQAIYVERLRRPTPPPRAETDGWTVSSADLKSIRIAIETTDEYFNRSS